MVKAENGQADITEMCSTDDESGDDQSTKTQDDVESEVTFEDDLDEEMDATTIEEEDWIDHKEKRWRCNGKDGTRTHSMLDQDPQKWNGNWHWELQLHRVRDGWKQLLSGALIWVQDIKLTERLEDREDDGKMTLMIHSNKLLKKKKMKTQSREKIKPTRLRSKLPKTGEDGLC